MPQARSGRTRARSGANDSEAEKKKTFIVKISAKSEVTSSVFDSEPSLVTSEERGADTDFTQTVILQAQQEETNSVEDQNFSEFSIPIDMVGGGDKGDFDQDLYGRISLSDQLSLNTSDLSQAGDIRNHVISIEENGRITIGIDSQFQGGAGGNLSTILEEPLVTPRQPHTPPKLPEWWLRLFSTLLSFLSPGYLVDVCLVCCDGEAVPAHQLLLSHAPPEAGLVAGGGCSGHPEGGRRPPRLGQRHRARPLEQPGEDQGAGGCPGDQPTEEQSEIYKYCEEKLAQAGRGQACYDIVKKHIISSENGNYQERAE